MNGKTNMLLFNKADQNAYLNSAANFRGMVHNADDDIEILFQSANSTTAFDTILLSCTNEKQVEAMKGLAGAVHGSASKAFTVVADDIASTYCHPNVTAIESITLGSTSNRKRIDATINNSTALARTLLASESGSLFRVDMTTVDNNVTLTLPIASASAGVMYDFVLTAASDDDADLIITTGIDAVDIFGTIGTSAAVSTQIHIPGNSLITLDGSVAQTEGVHIALLCDGDNWIVSGNVPTAVGSSHVTSAASA